MNNKELVQELLAIKDPETLMRKIHGLDPRTVSAIMDNEELLTYVGHIVHSNPEIREKIHTEYDRPEYHEPSKIKE